jgi:hypothetical protein
VAAVAAFAVLLLTLDARQAAADNEPFASSVELTGTVTDANPDARVVDITYTDAGGTTIAAASYIHGLVPFPATGDRVALEVSTREPTAVRLVDDRRTWHAELPLYGAGVLLALVFVASRQWHVRRLERLMASPAPSYAMLGAVSPPAGLARRWRLHLYALDAPAGAPPVCAVALVAVPSMPSGFLTVDVKGAPRPQGLVAVRADGEVLWPRGRALARTGRGPSRPATAGPLVPELPGGLPGPRRTTGSVGIRERRWTVPALRAAGLLALAGYLWSSAAEARAAERILEASRPAPAVVAEPAGDHSPYAPFPVEFTVAGRTVRALVDDQGPAPAPGSALEIRYAADRPTAAWPRDDAWPPGSDAGLSGLAALALCPAALVGAAVVHRRQRDRAAAEELLAHGRLTAGFPPTGWKGLGCRDGRLWYPQRRPGVAVDRVVLRLDPEGLVTVDGRGHESVLAWDRWPREWSVGRPASRPSGGLDVRTAAGVTRLARGGDGDDTVGDLVAFVASTPSARAGLADPGRVTALVALLVRDGDAPFTVLQG